jgi:hypothetical protein
VIWPLFLACTTPCTLVSNVADYQPICEDAVLAQYGDESRLVVPSDSGALVAYLPGDLSEETYGGTSGNPLTILLDLDGGTSFAQARSSHVTIARLDLYDAELQITASFEAGTIEGPLFVDVTQR